MTIKLEVKGDDFCDSCNVDGITVNRISVHGRFTTVAKFNLCSKCSYALFSALALQQGFNDFASAPPPTEGETR